MICDTIQANNNWLWVFDRKSLTLRISRETLCLKGSGSKNNPPPWSPDTGVVVVVAETDNNYVTLLTVVNFVEVLCLFDPSVHPELHFVALWTAPSDFLLCCHITWRPSRNAATPVNMFKLRPVSSQHSVCSKHLPQTSSIFKLRSQLHACKDSCLVILLTE